MINKEDIIGHAVKDVLFYREEKDGCEIYNVFYLLDNGVCFRLPLADAQFKQEEPPPFAEAAQLPQITGRRIESVVCAVHDGQIMLDSVGLLLDDGAHLCDVPAAPIGVSFAGIHISPPEKVHLQNLFDYWDEKKMQYEFY